MPNGLPINKRDAQALMTKQQEIVEANRLLIAADCLSRGQAAAGVYYLSQGSLGVATNCFIFDIEHFEKFKANGATQILAIQGAKEAGYTTMIMVGCTQQIVGSEVTYKSLVALGDEPGVQHPPVTVQPTMPIDGTGFSFTVSPDQ